MVLQIKFESFFYLFLNLCSSFCPVLGSYFFYPFRLLLHFLSRFLVDAAKGFVLGYFLSCLGFMKSIAVQVSSKYVNE
ncbi:hypothetical protein LguiB_020903 [Lonicera macranthoides]